MEKIKFVTDLEQSKRLAEILPLESADMYWWSTSLRHYIEAMDDGDFNEKEGHVRAWSLAALLDVLPTINNEFEPQLHRSLDKYFCTYEGEEDSSCLWRVADNPVDACYEMILKLNELKLL